MKRDGGASAWEAEGVAGIAADTPDQAVRPGGAFVVEDVVATDSAGILISAFEPIVVQHGEVVFIIVKMADADIFDADTDAHAPIFLMFREGDDEGDRP